MPSSVNSVANRLGVFFALASLSACASLLDPLPTNEAVPTAGGGGFAEDGGTSVGPSPSVVTGGTDSVPASAAGAAGGPTDDAPGTELVLAYPGSGATKGFNASVGNHNNGHQFEVTESGISVVDLGAWDFGADGLSGAHTVTLFSLDKLGADAIATAVPGGSVTVPAGADSLLDSGYRFAPLAKPIDLVPGPYAVVCYGLNALDAYGDGGTIPLPKTGIRDGNYDVFEVTSSISPAFPRSGDTKRHASASFHFLSRHGRFVKIMPLGDSITTGTGSAAGAGYRLPLAVLLQNGMLDFQFVGSMSTNPGMFLAREQIQHEGHEGAAIAAFPDHPGLSDSISTYLGPTGTTPDIILLLIGTNDIDLDNQVADAPSRIDALLDAILNPRTGAAPGARVILAKLPPIQDSSADARIVDFNAGLSGVVSKHKAAGQSIALVDMHAVLGPEQMADRTNPNDAGYAKMAQVWANAILSP